MNKQEKDAIGILLASRHLTDYLHRKEPRKWHVIKITAIDEEGVKENRGKC